MAASIVKEGLSRELTIIWLTFCFREKEEDLSEVPGALPLCRTTCELLHKHLSQNNSIMSKQLPKKPAKSEIKKYTSRYLPKNTEPFFKEISLLRLICCFVNYVQIMSFQNKKDFSALHVLLLKIQKCTVIGALHNIWYMSLCSLGLNPNRMSRLRWY